MMLPSDTDAVSDGSIIFGMFYVKFLSTFGQEIVNDFHKLRRFQLKCRTAFRKLYDTG